MMGRRKVIKPLLLLEKSEEVEEERITFWTTTRRTNIRRILDMVNDK